MSSKYLYSLILILFLFFSCKKEKKIEDLPPPSTSNNISVDHSGTYHTYPGQIFMFDFCSTISPDNNIVICCTTDTTRAFSLLKLNLSGNLIWRKDHFFTEQASSGYTGVFSICNTSDNCFFLLGTKFNSFLSSYNYYLIKMNNLGDTVLTKFLPGDVSSSNSILFDTFIIPLIDGNTLVKGKELGFTNPNSVFIKIDNSANIIWEENFQNWGYVFMNIMETSNGGFFLTGSYSDSINPHPYLFKTDASASFLWEQKFDNSIDIGYGDDVEELDNGDLMSSNISPGYFSLIKTNSNGDLIWSKKFNLNAQLENFKLIKSSDDNLFIIGSFSYSSGASFDLYLAKVDTSGNLIWQKGIGQTNTTEMLFDSFIGPDNNLYFIGNQYETPNSRKVFILKSDQNGNLF
jgi:hypothetical protein